MIQLVAVKIAADKLNERFFCPGAVHAIKRKCIWKGKDKPDCATCIWVWLMMEARKQVDGETENADK